MKTDREKRLEDALAQFIKPMKGIPFEVVIKGLCDVEVVQFDKAAGRNAAILDGIATAMREACRTVQRNPIERPRPNEVGNDMEPFVIEALRQGQMNAAAPRTRSGKGKATGYPDVRIEGAEYPIYIEVKTYAAATRGTTMRSFYLSPTSDPKVTEDAHHLLVGFEIEREGNLYTPIGFTLVDLYGLDCDMKAEFNSDNRRLYEAERLLVSERVPPAAQ